MPFDAQRSTKRTASVVKNGKDVFDVTKGAPQVILGMCTSCKPETRMKVEQKISELADRGIRSLGIARKLEGDERGWVWLGILTFTDPPRHDTKDTIEKANALGIDVKMITGDQVAIAKETCFQLGMGTNIHGTELIPGEQNTDESVAYRFEEIIEELNGFAEVFPEHKYKIVETFRKIGYRCGMTGDGVNDAPALKRADIGIAVEGATDAAVAAADIVLTEPGLGVIIDAIYISRKIFKRMKNYVTYRIACTIQLLLFFFIAVLAIHPDQENICLSKHVEVKGYPIHDYSADICKFDVAKEAFPTHFENRTTNTFPDCKRGEKDSFEQFCKCMGTNDNLALPGDECNPSYFKIPVIALVLITILNDGTIISIAYDNVKPSAVPEQWNLLRVCITSFVLGSIACASTLVLLFLGMRSGDGTSDLLYQWFGLLPLSLKQLECMIYLKISLSDFMTVFAARTNGFFFTQKPGKLLVLAFCAATLASTIFALSWPFGEMEGISGGEVGFVWLYCGICFFVQDIFKVATNAILDRAFEVTSNAEKREVHKQKAKNRKVLDRQRRTAALGGSRYQSGDHGADFHARRGGGLSSGQIANMDMASVLHRINTLTDELAMLKSVVMKHTGAGGSGDDGASSKLRTPSRDNSKNLMSQRSLDHAHRSRSRSESFR
jgi:H+-transporting ATPase